MSDSNANGMIPVVYGINHITATVNVRDKALFSKGNIIDFSQKLLEYKNIHEVVIISTCNRSEIYCAVSDNENVKDFIQKGWIQISQFRVWLQV